MILAPAIFNNSPTYLGISYYQRYKIDENIYKAVNDGRIVRGKNKVLFYPVTIASTHLAGAFRFYGLSDGTSIIENQIYSIIEVNKLIQEDSEMYNIVLDSKNNL